MSEEIVQKTVRSDMLIIGGGLSGCLAAIRARNLGASVVIVEKMGFERCGSAGSGIDHYRAYTSDKSIMPDSPSIEQLVDEQNKYYEGIVNEEIVKMVYEGTVPLMRNLEEMGISFRSPSGKLRIVDKNDINFPGRDIKPKLSRLVRVKGVKIYDRIMITKILTAGNRFLGATGFNIRSGEFLLFVAKTGILATGTFHRLYPNPTGIMSNTVLPTSLTGDCLIAAFRAGVEVTNLEFTGSIIGPRHFHRGTGITSFIPGKLVNAKGDNIFGTHRAMTNLTQALLNEVNSGRGPAYMDCTKIPDNEMDIMRWSLGHEGGGKAFLDYLRDNHIDLKKHKIEFGEYERNHMMEGEGVVVDNDFKTSIKGLFAAGDIVAGLRLFAPGAVVMGWVAGEKAAKYAQSGNLTDPISEQVTSEKERVFNPLTSSSRIYWQEMQTALENLMQFYTGGIRNEGLLSAGLVRVNEIKRRYAGCLKANNPHELMRVHEVLNLFDIAELVIKAALLRKESSRTPYHYRSDYPKQSSEYRKFIILRREGETIIHDLRPPVLIQSKHAAAKRPW